MTYGANLQVANYIVNFDLPWNPAKIDQRIARAMRRGQKESVTVYNLVTRDTIEDRILEKIGYKRQIFNKFINSCSEGKDTIKPKRSSFGLKELMDILRA
jgi:SNF2 family DNA or RNA helicase